MTAGVSLCGSTVMNSGCSFGTPGVVSGREGGRGINRGRNMATHMKGKLGYTECTYVGDHGGHLLQFVWADIGAEGEPKVEEDPLSEEVLVRLLLSVVVCEREWSAQSCFPMGLGFLLLFSWREREDTEGGREGGREMVARGWDTTACRREFFFRLALLILLLNTGSLHSRHIVHSNNVHGNPQTSKEGEEDGLRFVPSSFSFLSFWTYKMVAPPASRKTARDFHDIGWCVHERESPNTAD